MPRGRARPLVAAESHARGTLAGSKTDRALKSQKATASGRRGTR
nr:MAG TPA: hypothetical protein [Bacteriophage sp.]